MIDKMKNKFGKSINANKDLKKKSNGKMADLQTNDLSRINQKKDDIKKQPVQAFKQLNNDKFKYKDQPKKTISDEFPKLKLSPSQSIVEEAEEQIVENSLHENNSQKLSVKSDDLNARKPTSKFFVRSPVISDFKPKQIQATTSIDSGQNHEFEKGKPKDNIMKTSNIKNMMSVLQKIKSKSLENNNPNTGNKLDKYSPFSTKTNFQKNKMFISIFKKNQIDKDKLQLFLTLYGSKKYVNSIFDQSKVNKGKIMDSSNSKGNLLLQNFSANKNQNQPQNQNIAIIENVDSMHNKNIYSLQKRTVNANNNLIKNLRKGSLNIPTIQYNKLIGNGNKEESKDSTKNIENNINCFKTIPSKSSEKNSINLESPSNSFLKSNSLKTELPKLQNESSTDSNLKNSLNNSSDSKRGSNCKNEIKAKSNINGTQSPQFALKLIKIENSNSPSPIKKCFNKEMYTESQKWKILNNQIKFFFDNLEKEESKKLTRNNKEVFKKNFETAKELKEEIRYINISRPQYIKKNIPNRMRASKSKEDILD